MNYLSFQRSNYKINISYAIPIFVIVICVLAYKLIINKLNFKQYKKNVEQTISNPIIIEVPESKRTVKIKEKILDISMLPDNVSINDNNLPYLLNKKYEKGYGWKFNAFVLKSGAYFHKSKCRYVTKKKKDVIHRYIAMQKYLPCPYCKPYDNIDKWYINFLKVNYNVNNVKTLEDLKYLPK